MTINIPTLSIWHKKTWSSVLRSDCFDSSVPCWYIICCAHYFSNFSNLLSFLGHAQLVKWTECNKHQWLNTRKVAAGGGGFKENIFLSVRNSLFWLIAMLFITKNVWESDVLWLPYFNLVIHCTRYMLQSKLSQYE